MSRTGHSRRRVLGAAGAGLGVAALAGCGLFDDHPDRTPPDPLRAVLDEAVALAAAYDRVLVAHPSLSGRLTALADDHRAHAAELARVLGIAVPSRPVTAASPGATAVALGPSAAPTVDLRKAEQAAQKTAAAVCLRAPVARAALTGSIAACRATHAEALR